MQKSMRIRHCQSKSVSILKRFFSFEAKVQNAPPTLGEKPKNPNLESGNAV